MSWFNDLFINEAKPALNGRPSSGGSSEGGESSGGNSGPCSWNDLKDKPFIPTSYNDLEDKPVGYDNQWVEIAYVKNVAPSDRGTGYASVALATNGNKLVLGEAYKVVVFNGLVALEYEFIATGNTMSRLLGTNLEGAIYVYDLAPMGGMTAYIRIDSETIVGNSSVLVSIYHGELGAVELDEKFIPETIARTSEVVPAPATASIGQTVVVKAVDENGKPTEWETADMTSGEGGAAIIDVVELPTENIQEDVFYRLLTGVALDGTIKLNGWTVHVVETLPSEGDMAWDGTNGIVYYQISDNTAYGYVTPALSSVMGVPAGWYPGSVLVPAVGFAYGGIVYEINETLKNGTVYLLLSYVLYSYKRSWNEQESIGRNGAGINAETFNSIHNNATGSHSHAEGYETTASGYYSHAAGRGTVSSGRCQHVQGSFNIVDTEPPDGESMGKYLHIVGNGSGERPDGSINRSNAHTLDWDGNAWFAGGIELTSPNGTRYRFTVSDDGTLSAVVVTE